MSFSIERGFISKLLEVKDFSVIKDQQIKNEFFSGEHHLVFKYIQESVLKTGEVPTERVINQKFPTYKLEYFNEKIGTEESLLFWSNELRNKVKHDTMAELVENMYRKLDTSKTDIDDNFDYLKTRVAFIENEITISENVDITKDTEDRVEAYRKKKINKGITGIPTGIRSLDLSIGGFEDETLSFIVGIAGAGKSWVQIIMGAYMMLHGIKVIQFVTEMSTNVMRDRYEAILFKLLYGDFNYSDFKRGQLSLKQEEEFYNFLREDLPELEPLIIRTATGVINMRSEIENLKPDIVFIDGVYLMQDDQGAKEGWQKLTNITRDLKIMSKNLHLPIVGNTQLDLKSGGGLAGIKYASSVSQDCLPINTPILTEQGYKLIQNLDNEVFKVKVGDKLKKAKCSYVGKKQVTKISYCGRIFECSPNHKIRVYDNEVNDYVWKRAKDIEPHNDFILKYVKEELGGSNSIVKLKSNRGEKDIKIPYKASEELGRILGYMIGDGCIRPYYKGQVSLGCGYDREYAEESLDLMEKLFSIKGNHDIKKPAKRSEGQSASVWYSTKLSDWFKYFIEPFGDKYLHPDFISFNYEFRLGLLSGLLQSDGSLSTNSFSFSTVHKQLAEGFCKLCDSLGINTKVTHYKNDHKGKYDIRLRSLDMLKHANKLNVLGECSYYKEFELKGKKLNHENMKLPSSLVIKTAKNIITKISDSKNPLKKRAYRARREGSTTPKTLQEFMYELKDNSLENYLLIEVMDVINTENEKEMYDIQVFDEDHSIITDGIVTHNSDAIIELFRDELMIADHEMKLKVIKNREGSPSNIVINWDFKSMNFEEIFSEGVTTEKATEINSTVLNINEE